MYANGFGKRQLLLLVLVVVVFLSSSSKKKSQKKREKILTAAAKKGKNWERRFQLGEKILTAAKKKGEKIANEIANERRFQAERTCTPFSFFLCYVLAH